MKKRKRMDVLDQVLIGLLTIIAASFLAYFIFIGLVSSSYSQTEEEAIQIAKEKTDLTKVETFSVVTSDETIYSVTGSTSSGKKVAVLVPKKAGAIRVIDLSEGKSPAPNASVGLYKNQIIWETNTSSSFMIYDFKTGKPIN